MPAYAIGDIHGCANTFAKLLDQLGLKTKDHLYLLGDYIDRGPDSKGVIDKILELRSAGYTVYTLRGNHEQMMLDSVKDHSHLKLWLVNGGAEALQSFGEAAVDEIDNKYTDFLHQTEYYFETGRYLLVHAGLNLSIKDPLRDTDHMLWSRRKFANRYLDKTVIHGHTPTPLNEILKQDPEGAFINLDGGCVYDRPGMGHLVGFCLDTKEYVYTRNCEPPWSP